MTTSERELTRELFAQLLHHGCPDCGGDTFQRGPEGGLCVNYKCANPACGSRFNVGVGLAQRISEPSPDRAKCGGERKAMKTDEMRALADEFAAKTKMDALQILQIIIDEPLTFRMARALRQAADRIDELEAEVRETSLAVIDKRNAEVDRMRDDA